MTYTFVRFVEKVNFSVTFRNGLQNKIKMVESLFFLDSFSCRNAWRSVSRQQERHSPSFSSVDASFLLPRELISMELSFLLPSFTGSR